MRLKKVNAKKINRQKNNIAMEVDSQIASSTSTN